MVNDKGLPDPQTADDLMSCVLDHYLKHYDAVLRKLGHAKTATHQSVEVLENSERKEAKEELAEIQAYDGMWSKVIEMFRSSGVSEDELTRIEIILGGMPGIIKKHYEILIKQDKILQQLLMQLEAEEYKNAIETTRKIQGRRDIFSGLMPQDFELNLPTSQNAFLYKVPSDRNKAH